MGLMREFYPQTLFACVLVLSMFQIDGCAARVTEKNERVQMRALDVAEKAVIKGVELRLEGKVFDGIFGRKGK